MSNETVNPDIRKYKTSDIALAATLILYKMRWLGVEPVNKSSANKRNEIFHFVFEDCPERTDLVVKYSANSDDIKVSPNAFRSTIRTLKEATKNYKDE